MKKNEAINEQFNELVSSIRKQAIDEILDAVTEKQNAIYTLLYNGRPIFENAYGERFDKLYAQRIKLWDKHQHYSEIIDLIWKLR